MGWKTLRDRIEIKDHIVQVVDDNICIGSGYIHDLVTINTTSGNLYENTTFKGFLKDTYPSLSNVSTEDILGAINETDCFSDSIPVYTYNGGEIIEKYCEKIGWPNVTHDGFIMYENKFSTNKDQVIAWAKRNARAGVKLFDQEISRLNEKIKELSKEKEKCVNERDKLELDYPST